MKCKNIKEWTLPLKHISEPTPGQSGGTPRKTYGLRKAERFNHGSVPKQWLLQALFRIHRPIGVIKLDIIEDNREFESLWGEKTALNINIKKVRLETLYRCRLARHRVKSLENQILNSKLGPIKLKWFHFWDILTLEVSVRVKRQVNWVMDGPPDRLWQRFVLW